MPDAGDAARDSFTGQAFEREVTVGGLPDVVDIEWVRREIRHRIGGTALSIPEACDELVDTAIRWWPERRMADFARQSATSGPATLDAIAVISAKIREDVEHRWGLDANVTNALDLLAMAVVVELANLWFSTPENRIALRRVMFEMRQASA